MTYTTKNPLLFGKFFMEENPENLKKALMLFEKAHGISKSIDVVFVFDNGQVQRPATKSDTSYGRVLHYNYSDYAPSKYGFQRQLLIRVSPASIV